MKSLNAQPGTNCHKPLTSKDIAAQKAGHLAQMAHTTPYASDLFYKGLRQAIVDGQIAKEDVDSLKESESTLRSSAPWMPHEANPFLLQWTKELSDLGAPIGSIEWQTIEDGQSWKTRRDSPFDDAFDYDYSKHGWPASEGPSLRKVTPEEHKEILRRLNSFGLTMPGSEVSNVSWTLGQIMATEYPETPWMVDGLLRTGGAAMVYGMAGVGKTWFTLTLMLLAAHGKGLSTLDGLLKAGEKTGTKVLLLDGEMVVPDLKERISNLVEGLPGFDKEALDRITVYPKAAQDHRAKFFDLADRSWLRTLVEYVKVEGFGLVVLDNLSTLSPTLEDENAATAWSPLNDTIVALKREGVASLLVHHAGKGETYRGSSNIVATLETVVGLKEVSSGFDTIADARFRIEIEKSRNHGRSPLDNKTLRLQGGGFGAAWAIEIDEFSLTDAFVKAVRSLKYTTQKELGEALGDLSQATVSRVLATAEAQGKITRDEYRACLKKAKELNETKSAIADAEALDI